MDHESAGPAADLLRQRLGGSVAPRLAEQLLRRTDSDPTLLDAILDQVPAVADGLQRVPLRWPSSLSEPILSEVDGLPPLAREVVEVGAVIGREFDLAIVERACPDADVLGGLEAAAKLLEPLPGHVFSFRRALVREVCYDALGARRRALLHERVAAALTALGSMPGARSATVVELAYHLGEAAALGGGDRLDAAAAAAATAGATAASEGAHDLAAEYFAQAATLAGRAGWAPAQAGRLMVAAGTARLRAARSAQDTSLGNAALTAAVRMGHRAEDPGLIAAAALGFGARPLAAPLPAGSFPATRAGSSPAAPPASSPAEPAGSGARAGGGARREALEAAQECAHGLDLSVRARVAARFAIETGAAELALRANALAHESGDPRALAEASLAVAQLTGDRISLDHATREASALDDAELLARAWELLAAQAKGDAKVVALQRLTSLDGPQASAPVRWHARRAAAIVAGITADPRAEELVRQALAAGEVIGAGDTVLAGRPTQSKTDIGAELTATLTAREREVLGWALKGVSSKEIAEGLVLGERTVETHLASIYRKLEVRGRVELIMKFRVTDE